MEAAAGSVLAGGECMSEYIIVRQDDIAAIVED